MKYIKDFDTWLNENYPSFGNEPDALPLTESFAFNDCTPPTERKYGEHMQTDISNLVFSFFDGGESKFRRKLEEFNDKYKTSLNPPDDWTSLTMLDDPEKVYIDIEDFVTTYTELIT